MRRSIVHLQSDETSADLSPLLADMRILDSGGNRRGRAERI
jgi:hypothetical protein